MAIALVNSGVGSGAVGINSGASGTTLTVTVGVSGVASGHHLISGVGFGTTTTTVAMSDTKGNTYQQDQINTGQPQKCAIFSSFVTTPLVAGDIITVTWGASIVNPRMAVYEWSGLATSSWLDQKTGAGGTSATLNSGSVTTLQADELIFGTGMYANAGSTFTATGSNAVLDNFQISPNAWLVTTDRIVSATGTYAASGTIVSSVNETMAVATYKAATVAATSSNQYLPMNGIG